MARRDVTQSPEDRERVAGWYGGLGRYRQTAAFAPGVLRDRWRAISVEVRPRPARPIPTDPARALFPDRLDAP